MDLDLLSITENKAWIWKGIRALPRAREPLSEDRETVSRVLISLSTDDDDDSTMVVVREFDLLASAFVEDDKAFSIHQLAHTIITYKTRDSVYIASDFGPETLTNAGFPRTIREWKRGTDLKNAPVVFEGSPSDLAVTAFVNDQRHRGGNIHEIHTRILSSSVAKHWVRKVKYEQLTGVARSIGKTTNGQNGFKQMLVPEDSEFDFVGNVLLIRLRSKWQIENGPTFRKNSIVYVNSHKFLKYGPADRIYHILFESNHPAPFVDHIITKNFLILSVSEASKSRLEFYRLEKDGNKFRHVFKEETSEAHAVTIRPADDYSSDKFWYCTAGLIQPSTLWLADASTIDRINNEDNHRTGLAGCLEKKVKTLLHSFDTSKVVVKHDAVNRTDGTKILFFVVYNRDMLKDKKNPTLLQGYGALGHNVGSSSVALPGMAWIERGGVYVEAQLCGDSEMRHNSDPIKHQNYLQKAIDDFVAVAEHLTSTKICSSKTLAIRGGGEGSLVVTNAYLTRPDLFAAVSCHAPVTDLKRLAHLGYSGDLIDRWFGPSNCDENEKLLEQLSPYQNIDRSIMRRPPILFTTISDESLVPPGHARKMVKRLWNEGIGRKWPALYFDDSSASSSPDEQHAFVTTMAFDFLFKKVTKPAR